MSDKAEPAETIIVDSATIACDGGGEPLGHPKVYLNLGPDGRIDCPYCGRRFVLDVAAANGAGH